MYKKKNEKNGFLCTFLSVLVSVLLSTSVERFSVSRMRDFFLYCSFNFINIYNFCDFFSLIFLKVIQVRTEHKNWIKDKKRLVQSPLQNLEEFPRSGSYLIVSKENTIDNLNFYVHLQNKVYILVYIHFR